jgi:hypothetical protein
MMSQARLAEPQLVRDAMLALSVLREAAGLLVQAGYKLPALLEQERRQDSFQRHCEDAVPGGEAMLFAETPGSYLDNIKDNFLAYQEMQLPDGCLLRTYENGNVRRINPRTQLIEEETAEGNLLMSLPDGRYIFQEMPGAPLFLHDAEQPGHLQLVRAAGFQIGHEHEIPAFYFEDGNQTLLIDLETLRTYRLRMGVQALYEAA